MVKRVFFVVVVFAAVAVLSGCHTVHGMGQDLESAGHSIEKAAGK